MRMFLLFVWCAVTLFPFDVMLLKRYRDQNVTGWVMSEKLDGIRAFWDGSHLYTRSGHLIHAPKWFLKHYPPFAIDGELWTKRGDFEHIAAIVLDQEPGDGWREIKHYIFDVPNAKGDLFARLATLKPFCHDVIRTIPQIKITSKGHMMAFFHKVVSHGGEGIVIRDPTAPYLPQRSATILKLKPFFDDECRVVGYVPGKGRLQGMVGSIRCLLKDGHTVIKVGSGLTQAIRKHPPSIGSTLTFRYSGYTKKGLPRFPVFVRERAPE